MLRCSRTEPDRTHGTTHRWLQYPAWADEFSLVAGALSLIWNKEVLNKFTHAEVWPDGSPLPPSSRVSIAVNPANREGYTAPMLWVKSFHIVFIASWFAGLFYLPRIFVNLAMVPPESVAERERLLLMARKLLRFTTLLAFPALATGLWLYLWYKIGFGPGNGWMHAKLALVALVIGYHYICSRVLATFGLSRNARSHVWFRWFNEMPVILLVAVVVLVVVKP